MYTKPVPLTPFSPVPDFTIHSATPKPKWLKRLHPPAGFLNALAEAIVWMGAAAAMRISFDVFMTTAPNFWLPGVLVLISPAIVAAAIAIWLPDWSLILGYRSVLLMLGVLLGGKL
jgi:hypothetical protein